MTVYEYFAYPETKGLSMEHMEELFNMPWYHVSRASTKVIITVGAEPTLDEKKERGINMLNECLNYLTNRSSMEVSKPLLYIIDTLLAILLALYYYNLISI